MISDKQLLKIYDNRNVEEEAQVAFQNLSLREKARLSDLAIEREVFE